jgi:integrase
MIRSGHSRRYINKNIGRIKRMFKWACGEQLIPPQCIAQTLWAVDGLRKGRTEAREKDPVAPVAEVIVEATLPHLPPIVADLVRFERLTGCRPSEVCVLRPCDLDRGGDVWEYRPHDHKTEHYDRKRVIFIGPQAQGILLRYLARDATTHCFRPRDSMAKHLAARHEARRTPMSCGNAPGSNRRRRPKRSAGDRYSTDSYRRAIHRACDKAFPAPEEIAADPARLAAWQSEHRWAPNQLRHSAATEIRRRFGLEAAQVTLGHSKADVTQVYAERDYALAARVAREVG